MRFAAESYQSLRCFFLDLAAQRQESQQTADLTKYRGRPVDYAREVLKTSPGPWSVQQRIAELIHQPPYRVLVQSSHSVGKTWAGAWLTSYWFDTMGAGSCVLTTAPTHRDVCDLLWTEIRNQREAAGLNGFVGTKAPELWRAPNWFAKGFTAARGESFQGRHPPHILFIFDEAVGIDSVFWRTMRTMFAPDGNHAAVCFFNPTDTSSEAYQQCQSGNWHVVQMSSLDHPNLKAELSGQPVPYPGAVNRAMFEDWLAEWSDAIPVADAISTDIEWPPGSGHWYRPGPEMESRGLGRWPSQSTYGVWSQAAWHGACRQNRLPLHWGNLDLPEIGCDVARYGDDDTTIVVRWGPCALHYERHNGWDGPRVVGRLKELAREWAEKASVWRIGQGGSAVPAQQIRVKIDSDGLGGMGVLDWANPGIFGMEYQFVGVGASTIATRADRYPNKRSELWFETVEKAKHNNVDLSRLGKEALKRLEQEAMAPVWKLDAAGRRVAEPKEATKKRLGNSPDSMDALNLAYYTGAFPAPVAVASPVPDPHDLRPVPDSAQRRGGLFGGRER